ncbi:MAG: FkbM family methyltransferase [Chloroflexi bacterium]|nr:FkbM family methyltransferase [Chloroflexota bacterium]
MLRRCGWDIVRFPPPAPKQPVDPWLYLRRLDIRTVIDVGAFDGDTGRIYRKMWPDAVLHCFEPQAAPYAALKAWAAQEAPNVRTYDCALGDAPGTGTMRGLAKPTETLKRTSLVKNFDGSSHEGVFFETIVRIEKMDDVLDAAALTPGIFVKIDVEGFERAVLHGASTVLDRAAACVIEHHTRLTPHGAADMAEIAGMLENHGLTFTGMVQQVFGKNGRYVYGDALFTNWSRCTHT